MLYKTSVRFSLSSHWPCGRDYANVPSYLDVSANIHYEIVDVMEDIIMIPQSSQKTSPRHVPRVIEDIRLLYLDVSLSMLTSPCEHPLRYGERPSKHPHVMFHTL